MPETDHATRKPAAVAFLEHAAERARRADRALAHAIRAAQRNGVEQGAILGATSLEWAQVLECLDRWPGDA